MTYQEAIKILSEEHAWCGQACSLFHKDEIAERYEAIGMAISALKRAEMLDTLEQRGLKEYRK